MLNQMEVEDELNESVDNGYRQATPSQARDGLGVSRSSFSGQGEMASDYAENCYSGATRNSWGAGMGPEGTLTRSENPI